MNRADDVVELVAVEDRGDRILAPGNEVHLDPEPKLCRAHELAVPAEIIAAFETQNG